MSRCFLRPHAIFWVCCRDKLGHRWSLLEKRILVGDITLTVDYWKDSATYADVHFFSHFSHVESIVMNLVLQLASRSFRLLFWRTLADKALGPHLPTQQMATSFPAFSVALHCQRTALPLRVPHWTVCHLPQVHLLLRLQLAISHLQLTFQRHWVEETYLRGFGTKVGKQLCCLVWFGSLYGHLGML